MIDEDTSFNQATNSSWALYYSYKLEKCTKLFLKWGHIFIVRMHAMDPATYKGISERYTLDFNIIRSQDTKHGPSYIEKFANLPLKRTSFNQDNLITCPKSVQIIL